MQTCGYSTANELEFLDKIGTFCSPNATLYNSRIQLLIMYRHAIALRSNWGGINQNDVWAYLARELKPGRVTMMSPPV